MSFNQFVKSFIAGMVFPGIFLPLAYTIFYFVRPVPFHENPLQFIPMYIPLLFGIANVISASFAKPQVANGRLWLTGILLGLIVSIVGVFALNIPALVFGFSDGLKYAPIIFLPIIYGIIFRYFVKWLESVL